jgi:DNA polymerase I
MKNIVEFHANNQKVMLVDGDLLAYKITSAIEQPIDWGNDVWTLHSDLKVAKANWEADIKYYQQYTHSKNVIICFSDKENFRKKFDNTYKSYRKKIRKPIAYAPLRDWIKKNYQWVSFPNLEGDDVLGLLATGVHKTNNVIISGDKDMRTIPTWHCFIGDDRSYKSMNVINKHLKMLTIKQDWQEY